MTLTDFLQKVNTNDANKKIIIKNDYIWNNIKNIVITKDTIQLIMDDTHVFGQDN